MKSISIIIPIYNGKEFLKECLDSVVAQDIEEKEVICVDDGSTDNSVEIVKQYQEKYGYITLIKQKNQGAAVARNAALDVAQGEYIAFMDADDVYLNSCALRVMVETCKENQTSVCGSFHTQIRNGEIVPVELWREDFQENKAPKRMRYEDYQMDYYYQNYIFERNFIEQYGLRFPNLRRYQDPPFFVKAMWYAKEFMVVPIEMYGYRLRSFTMKFTDIQINDTLQGMLQNTQFAKEKGLNILLNNTINRLDFALFERLKNSIYNGNIKAIQLLVEIQTTINELEQSYRLRVLEEVKGILYESQFIKDNRYQFPFEKIAKDSRVIVYGAGVAGKQMVSRMQSMTYCYLYDWVDKNYIALTEQGYDVHNPEDISREQADYVLVAVEREDIYKEVKEILQTRGWSSEKIIGPLKKKV